MTTDDRNGQALPWPTDGVTPLRVYEASGPPPLTAQAVELHFNMCQIDQHQYVHLFLATESGVAFPPVLFDNYDQIVEYHTPLAREAVSKIPRLKDGERGTVVGPPFRIPSDGELFWGGKLDPQELRFSLLFWERLVVPQGAALLSELGDDGEFLRAEGVLDKVRLNVSDFLTRPGLSWKATYLALLDALNAKDARRWSLAVGERTLQLGSAASPSNGPALSFELHKVIPVPDRDVPLAEVLFFRQRRQAELLALRTRLDEIYLAISTAPDRELAQTSEMTALRDALRDYMKVAREWHFPVRLTGFKAKIDIKTWGGAAGGFQFASVHGMPQTISVLAGLTGAVLASLSVDVGRRQTLNNSSPYEYVSRFHEEVGL